MNIYIVNYNYHNNTVLFYSEYGEAIGVWKGDEVTCGAYYSVELDIPQVVGQNCIKRSVTKAPKICMRENRVNLIGHFSEFENGCATLTIGTSIIFFELDVNSYDCKELVGNYISIEIERLDLYDEKIL